MKTYVLLIALTVIFGLQNCTHTSSAPTSSATAPVAEVSAPPAKAQPTASPAPSVPVQRVANALTPEPVVSPESPTPPGLDITQPVNIKLNLDFFQSKPNGKPWDGADPALSSLVGSLIPLAGKIPLHDSPPDIKVFILTADGNVRPLKEFGLNSRHLLLQDVVLPAEDFALFVADLDGDFKLTPAAWHDYIGAAILTSSAEEMTDPERMKWTALLRRAMHSVGIQDFDHPAQIPGQQYLQIPDHFPEYSLTRCAEAPCSLDDQENVVTLQFLPSRRKR